jgi:acyl-CoA synthetase (AMP-forming)/AMP-acid ligase II
VDLLVHLRRSAAVYPDKLAVADGDHRFSWSQFDERTRRLAAALTGLGLKKGERVGVLMYNGFRYLEAFYAIPRLGGVIVPLNIRYSPPELAYVLNDCQVGALLFDEAFIPMIEKARPDLKSVRHFILSEGQNRPDWTLDYDYEGLVEK